MTDSLHESPARTMSELCNGSPFDEVFEGPDQQDAELEDAQEMSVYDDIRLEVERSIGKHGYQLHRPLGTGSRTYPLEFASPNGPTDAANLSELAKDFVDEATKEGSLTWQQILMEEVMEAAAADDLDDLRTELVQVAAVAVKFITAVEARQQVRAYVI